MSRLQVAHLTDLHLRHSLPGSSRIYLRRSRIMPNLFRQLVDTIASRIKPDLLLLTGDLLDVPFYAMNGALSTAEGSPLAGAILEDYRLIRDILVRSGLRFIVIPGNHDDELLMRKVFTDMKFLEQTTDYDFLVFHHDRERGDHFPLREFSRYDTRQGAGRPSIHVQHYVVTPTLNEGYPHTYANAGEILSRNAGAGGPLLSVSGHYHDGYGPVTRDGCAYFVAGALCEPPYRWYLYQIEDSHATVEERWLASEKGYEAFCEPVGVAAVDELLSNVPKREGPWLATVDGSTPEERCDNEWTELSRRGLEIQGVYPISDFAQRSRLVRMGRNGFKADSRKRKRNPR